MKLLDRFALKTTAGMVWLLVRELRRLTHAIETGVDSFRQVHGHRPLFEAPTFHAEHAADPDPDTNRTIPRFEDDTPDWLRLDLLAALAREQHVLITDDTDLVQVGRERGWIDEAGQLVVLPKHYLD